MDWEHQLVQKIVVDREPALRDVLERGITPDYFKEELHRDVFTFIVEQWHKNSGVPTAGDIKDNWPNYKLAREVEDTLDRCIEKVWELHRRSMTILTAAAINDAVQSENIEEAINRMALGLNVIQSSTSVLVDENLVENWDERLEDYKFLNENKGKLLGVPTGFPSIDEATAGLQPEQFIVLIATPKTGKSLIALRVAQHAHQQGKKILFIGFEMSNREQRWRYDSMTTETPYEGIVRGALNTEEFAKFQRSLKQYAADAENDFILSADINSATTVSGARAKIEHHNPDIVFIDGLYFMDDESGEFAKGTPQAMTNITRGLKRVAQKTRTPIFGTTQALTWKSKGGLSMDSIGYSSSFAQDADVIMGLERQDEEDATFLNLRILRARNTGSKQVTIRADWTTYKFTESQAELEEAMDQLAEESGGGED